MEIQQFELMKKNAELKALSNVSLERPLNDSEFKRIMELKRRHLIKND